IGDHGRDARPVAFDSYIESVGHVAAAGKIAPDGRAALGVDRLRDGGANGAGGAGHQHDFVFQPGHFSLSLCAWERRACLVRPRAVKRSRGGGPHEVWRRGVAALPLAQSLKTCPFRRATRDTSPASGGGKKNRHARAGAHLIAQRSEAERARKNTAYFSGTTAMASISNKYSGAASLPTWTAVEAGGALVSI